MRKFKKLMESTKEITDDIRDYLIGSLHPESNETEDSIKEMHYLLIP